VSFFDPIPAPEESCDEEIEVQEWERPPPTVLGGVVACQLLLARTDDVLLVATHFEAYPNGLAFELVSRVRDSRSRIRRGRFGFWGEDEDPAAGLRVGALFADGRRAQSFPMDFENAGDPARPVLWSRGGGGSENEWHQGYWLWPAPPAGDLVIVAQWIAEGVPETRATVGADLLADARTRIVEGWPSKG
jgi:hypothetical protein